MVDVLEIPAQPGLDPITVYWHNYEHGKGMVTVVCYGSAWNCYFGGMSGRTIQEFFAYADTSYLTPKLNCAQFLKKNRGHDRYVAQIIDVVKAALKLAEEGARL
jgi:hypothetical protein